MKPDKIPIIVRVSIPQTRFDPGAVDTELYCVNTTSQTYTIVIKGESFTTIDEREGHSVEHGSSPGKYQLLPGDCVKVADVEGWEWDGHVGIEVTFHAEGTEAIIVRNYNLKEGSKEFSISQLNRKGWIILPIE